MKKYIPIQPFTIKIILKDDPNILRISSDSIRNENKTVFLFKDKIENSEDKLLINENKPDDNTLLYEIGPAKINTLQNTVNDLLNHFELAKKISNAANKMK